MNLGHDQIRQHLDALAQRDEAIARALATFGHPAPRARPRGFETLLRIIVGQQVSVAAADAIWARIEAALGQQADEGASAGAGAIPGATPCAIPGARPAARINPQAVLAQDEAHLRALGLSRQKVRYVRSACEMMAAGAIDLGALPADDEAAIAALTRITGVGRWSAEIYLLFAEGRADIWPAGDLAVMAGIGAILGLAQRPHEKATRTLAQQWRPHRSALAIMAWHVHDQPAGGAI